MKRMVENSEKIEELAEAINIDNDGNTSFNGNVEFNNELKTSNITNEAGEKIYLIREDRYNIKATISTILNPIISPKEAPSTPRNRSPL